ncbi:glucose-1-phosphate adenylyltransferase subunit GlgD [Paraclostridium ghonii]|uniref:glucose-1-phosphate adenylyltransferase subunit GlgD n=1 Tax=Paraclostridium ghonii TaxID=29358 RepID=UPI00202CBB6A|nr:glucose-1-phosphate adenylyltransferase subunit GlgD [Paeniclostridium ghonii]MCM0164999.1 glucose-1-phosphate adenylyltransferase subunit GlgD [Paeniclostridium ghonii]
MNKECMGIINLNKKGDNLKELSDSRVLGSIPIGGRYRIIDFALSNMVNAGMKNIGIFSDQKYRSLTDHLGNGSHWDLSAKNDGLFVFSPENTKKQICRAIKKGDIHNIFSNIDYIEKSKQEYVLISPSYMICNIDYKKSLNYHKLSGDDITIIYKNVDNADEDFIGTTILNINDKNQISSMGINIGRKSNVDISMDMYIMKKSLLIDMIYDAVSTGEYTNIEDYINESLEKINIGAYQYSGYLKCINSTKSYFETNKDLLNVDVANELFYSDRKVFTKEKNEQPTLYTETSNVKNSFVATGCVIEGEVQDSIIFRKVHVKKGSVIKNSIVMQNSTIQENVKLDNVILDKNVFISRDKELKGDIKLPLVVEKNVIL